MAAPNTGFMTKMLHLGDTPSDRITGPLPLDIDKDPLLDPSLDWWGVPFLHPQPGDVVDFSITTNVITTRPEMKLA